MRDRNCPACDQPIYRNHHCRASALHDPPVPFNREEFNRMREEARAEAEAQANADAQLTLLEVDR